VLIPFIGYAAGRRLIGYVDCENERLTDLLNRSESLVIRDAFVENFADETIVNLGDGEIDRSILYAVEATGGHGEGARRIHAVRHRMQVQLGPYSALGLLHALPGQNSIAQPASRGPMIPLSDATLGFENHGLLAMRDVGTLIVNRDLVDWVRASDDEAMAFPGVPALTDRS
jgi:hypothetical protein